MNEKCIKEGNINEEIVTTKKSRILSAAKKCSTAKEVLKELYPEVFDEDTYKDISNKLLSNSNRYYVDIEGNIRKLDCGDNSKVNPLETPSLGQLRKLIATNKLMNVAKYLNYGWTPDWTNGREYKHKIIICDFRITTCHNHEFNNGTIYFKSKKLAEKAIKILGEEEIRLALCTDY